MTHPAIDKARHDRFWGVMIMGLGVFTAIGFFIMFGHAKAKHETAMAWPEVGGKVSSSKLVAKQREDRVGKRIVRRTEYVNEWTMSYEVDGKQYKKKRTSNGHTSSEIAGRNMRRTGEAIRVHYNPENPATAREHSDDSIEPVAAIFIGGFIVMIGGLLYRSKSRKLQQLLQLEEQGYLSADGEDMSQYLDDEPAPEPSGGIELESSKYLAAAQR